MLLAVAVVFVRDWFCGHVVRAVDPLRQVLQFAAFAAERRPWRLCGLTAAKDAHTLVNHGLILWYRRRQAKRGWTHPSCASAAWCRTSRPETMKITSSAMLVAWSPTRSRWREIKIRSSAGSIVTGSWSM